MFVEKMLQLMKEKKITRKQISADLGFGINQIKYWQDHKNTPSADVVAKIADYLGVPVEYFFTEQKKPSPEGESYEENVIILHRDGKTTVRKYTKEQLDAIEAMLNQIGNSDS